MDTALLMFPSRSLNEYMLFVRYHMRSSLRAFLCCIFLVRTLLNTHCLYSDAEELGNVFGPGSGPIFLDQLTCSGTEASLLECSSRQPLGLHSCAPDHSEDVGIRCQGRRLPSIVITCSYIVCTYNVLQISMNVPPTMEAAIRTVPTQSDLLCAAVAQGMS